MKLVEAARFYPMTFRHAATYSITMARTSETGFNRGQQQMMLYFLSAI
jgi:hypothetical protein